MLQAGAPASFSPWHDGTYTGMLDLPTPQFLVVEVDITQGQIVAIRLQQHPAWKAPEEQELLLHRVLERQTTNVEALREEGSEQDLLLRAIEDALSKAQREAPLRP
jgi:uncharacterized protein with FMN-binding domain